MILKLWISKENINNHHPRVHFIVNSVHDIIFQETEKKSLLFRGEYACDKQETTIAMFKKTFRRNPQVSHPV